MFKLFSLISFLTTACVLFGTVIAMPQSNPKQTAIRFLPLGDSYTICEGAKWEESWPYLLVQNLKKAGVDIELLANPSVTGFTTDHLIEDEFPVFDRLKPNFVTVLIGVNDYVQGRSVREFESQLDYILDYVQKRLPDKSKLVLITIPDYSVTPGGAHYEMGRDVTAGIKEFNQIIQNEAAKRHLLLVDIFPSTVKMKNNSHLIAADGLHPSAIEYANWEVLIRQVVMPLFQK